MFPLSSSSFSLYVFFLSNKSKKIQYYLYFLTFYYPILFSFSIYFLSLYVTFFHCLGFMLLSSLFLPLVFPFVFHSFFFCWFVSLHLVGRHLGVAEGHMDCCYFLFAHCFFLFIVNLFKCSHRHLPPSLYVFFSF